MSALTRRQQIELQLWTALIAARVSGEIPAQSANIHTIAADILRGGAPKKATFGPKFRHLPDDEKTPQMSTLEYAAWRK